MNVKEQPKAAPAQRPLEMYPSLEEKASKLNKPVDSIFLPGDADLIDAVAGALSFNPCWSKHIEALGRAYKAANAEGDKA